MQRPPLQQSNCLDQSENHAAMQPRKRPFVLAVVKSEGPMGQLRGGTDPAVNEPL
jgi:hypothetical protein